MNGGDGWADPHVVSLHYRFESRTPDHHDFDRAQPLSGAVADFDFELADGLLVARPRGHYANEVQARDAVEPHLRDWELGEFLAPDDKRIRFRFERAEIVDRAPVVPGRSRTVRVMALDAFIVAENASVRIGHSTYPAPDPGFRSTPLVEVLVERIRKVRDGEAEPTAVGYFLLTSLEATYGGSKGRRAAAAKALAVEGRVLDKLGGLTGRGDPVHGRKYSAGAQALTPDELGWIKVAMVRLARRVGEVEAGSTPPLLTMGDLPTLP